MVIQFTLHLARWPLNIWIVACWRTPGPFLMPQTLLGGVSAQSNSSFQIDFLRYP
jgi:hypothetical protein